MNTSPTADLLPSNAVAAENPADPLLNILHEDADLLVVNKPAGLVCHPTKTDARSSLIGRARLHVRDAESLHLVSRLDRETSGVVVLAKNSPVAGELGKIWEKRGVEKEYLAIVHGHVAVEQGIIDAPLGKDTASEVAIKNCVRPDGAAAHTEFRVERRWERDGRPFTLLRVLPLTGRKHQIRIHLAHAGHPIVGDKIYGVDERLYLRFVKRELTPEEWQRLILPHHALHAVELRFHWHDQDWRLAAEPEAWFAAFAFGAERAA